MSENAQGAHIAESSHELMRLLWQAGTMHGDAVRRSRKTLGDLRDLFARPEIADQNRDIEVYSVEWFCGGEPGAEGGLLFGSTRLLPGRVGDEYFMTHGHFHALPTRAEIYLPVSGEGLLLRRDRSGDAWAESMSPGALLYIEGQHAHRVVNTGAEPLVFWACWPSDAGYDYASITRDGFGLRVVEQDGQPALVNTRSMQEK
ncbi:MAG TPA: glucose-6-phosphate isomerase family protein [Acidobacteriaceae bacterium]|nr:glucose-6-phosphate isomerase family protein [Acidobacteriaceae bacterium]